MVEVGPVEVATDRRTVGGRYACGSAGSHSNVPPGGTIVIASDLGGAAGKAGPGAAGGCDLAAGRPRPLDFAFRELDHLVENVLDEAFARRNPVERGHRPGRDPAVEPTKVEA